MSSSPFQKQYDRFILHQDRLIRKNNAENRYRSRTDGEDLFGVERYARVCALSPRTMARFIMLLVVIALTGQWRIPRPYQLTRLRTKKRGVRPPARMFKASQHEH